MRSVFGVVEKLDDPGLEGILGADHHEPGILNQVFDDVGAMAQTAGVT